MIGAETGSSRDRPRAVVEIDAAALSRVFSAPTWLRDIGLLARFLLGVSLLVIGATWLAAAASSIVVPVILGVVASVAARVVSWLQSHGAERAACPPRRQPDHFGRSCTGIRGRRRESTYWAASPG
jgi:hypothetical protein